MKKKNLCQVSQALMSGALAAIILAGIGALGKDLWLASTQWLLVAAVLALFGIYLRVEG